MNKTNVISRPIAAPSFDWSTPADIIVAPIASIASVLLTWQERLSVRNDLERMSTRQLEDIGLTKADIATEVNKPFWQS